MQDTADTLTELNLRGDDGKPLGFPQQLAVLKEQSFETLMGLIRGLQFELDLSDYHLRDLRAKGYTNLDTQTTGAEGLLALVDGVNRGALFQALDAKTDPANPDGQENANVYNKRVFDLALGQVSQLPASSHAVLSFNAELSGTQDGGFIDHIEQRLAELPTEERARAVSRLRMEITERGVDQLKGTRNLMRYQENISRLAKLGVDVVVDDLVIDPKNPGNIIDPRLTAPEIKGIKLDISQFKPTHDGDRKYSPAERDVLPFDADKVKEVLCGLREYYRPRPVPDITLECIGSAANFKQVMELLDDEDNYGLNIGAQGYAISKPVPDLLALTSGYLDKDAFKDPDFIAPVVVSAPPPQSTRPNGMRRIAAAFIGLFAFGTVSSALMQNAGQELPPNADPEEDGVTEVLDNQAGDLPQGARYEIDQTGATGGVNLNDGVFTVVGPEGARTTVTVHDTLPNAPGGLEVAAVTGDDELAAAAAVYYLEQTNLRLQAGGSDLAAHEAAADEAAAVLWQPESPGVQPDVQEADRLAIQRALLAGQRIVLKP